jgi:signal transduction histidine kinase
MKSEGARKYQNRILSIGGRESGTMEPLNLCGVVRGMRRELCCLLRENICLHVSDTSHNVGRVRAFRDDIEDLIRHLVLDARDAMPAGGELSILSGTVDLDADYARTHPEIPAGDYAMLVIRDTGDGSNLASLKALAHEPAIRKGRSLGFAACYSIIDRLGGHLCVSRQAHETVIKIYLRCARNTPARG